MRSTNQIRMTGETRTGRIQHVFCVLFLLAILLAGGAAQAQNLLTNGSFESGVDPGVATLLPSGSTAIDDWVVLADLTYVGTQWAASDGGRSAALTGIGTIGACLYQAFPSEVSETYRIELDMAGDFNGAPVVKDLYIGARVDVGGSLGAIIDGTEVYFDTTGASASDMGWQRKQLDFTATTASSYVEICSRSSSLSEAVVDNVSVRQLGSSPLLSGDTYEYDVLDRLTRVMYADGTGVYYEYDAAGNIVATPEPGLGSSVLMGVLGLAGVGRRRRRVGRGRASRSVSSGSSPKALGVISLLVLMLLSVALPFSSLAQSLRGSSERPDWREAVRERIADSEYEVSWRAARLRKASEAWQAPNRAHNFRTHFMDEGIRVTPRDAGEGGSWEFGLSYLGYGRGDSIEGSDRRGTPRAEGRRVRYQRGNVVEWFVNDRRGLEQGFSLNAPPRSGGRGRRSREAGPAYVALRVDGDARPVLAEDRQSVDFVRAGLPVAVGHYDHLEVVDANGEVLDSWMEVTKTRGETAIRLVFDDREAAYPIEIDPLLTTPGWTFEGNQGTEGAGFSVAGAGDVNGDGYDDVLVGAPWFDGGLVDTGRAYLFLGAPTGLSTVPSWYTGHPTLAANSRLGYTVAAAGDVDGDSYDDFLVASVPPNNVNLPGEVRLFRGGPTGPGASEDWRLIGRAFRRMGYSVAGAGDLNGDGFDDIAIGEPGGLQTIDQGRVYVFFGQTDDGNGPALLGGSAVCTAFGEGTPGVTCPDGFLGAVPAPDVWGWAGSLDEYGEVVAAAGNVNGDAYDDLVVGQPGYGSGDWGRIQIFFGGPGGITRNHLNPDYELLGSDVQSSPLNDTLDFGRSIVSAGPLDIFLDETDGDDLLVGAPGRDPRTAFGDPFDGFENGSVYLIRSDGNDPPSFSIPEEIAIGTIPRGTFGASLANVGDVNGDTADDFLVGAPGENNFSETAGRAYLILGPTSSLDPFTGNTVWRADGEAEGDYLGSSVSGAGDVDNDGYADLLIGSATARIGRHTISETVPTGGGSAFVFYGKASGMISDLLGTTFSSLIADAFGWVGDRTDNSLDWDSESSPAIGRGPAPDSLILSTGLAQDEGTGATNWDSDVENDHVFAGFVIDLPSDFDAEALRFTTQYLTADPSEERAKVVIEYKYNPSGVNDSAMDLLTLDTPIEEAGTGESHAPISHAIDVSDPNITQIGLRLRVTEPAVGSVSDTAVVLSKIFFTDLPLPDYLSDPAEFPGFPDTNVPVDNRADYVTNPRPSDVSASAGPFRYSMTLLDVPGKLQPFRLSLSYDSERTREEDLGAKWSHSLASTAIELPDGDDADTCVDSVFVWLGGGQLEVFDGTDASGFCMFEPRYPGVYSRLVAASGSGYRHTSKDNFESTFEPVVPGSPDKQRRTERAHPNGLAISSTYLVNTDQIDFMEDSRGEIYDFAYDDTFDPPRLVSVTGPGAQVSFGYGVQGFLSTVTDANGLQTSFTYDDSGKLLTITDDDGIRLVENEYEGFAGLDIDREGDRVVRQMNARPGDLGRTTTYSGDALETHDRIDGAKLDRYDVFGRVVQTRLLLDSATTGTLDQCSRGDSTYGVRWCAVWDYVYDSQNRLVQKTDPLGFVTDMAYDESGNLICQTVDVDQAPTRTRARQAFLFDQLNNQTADLIARSEGIESALPACPNPGDALTDLGPNVNSDWFVSTFTYEGDLDYLISRTDPSNNTTQYGYGEGIFDGLLDTVINPDTTMLTIDRDFLGYPNSITNEAGEASAFTTDLLGRRSTSTDALGNISRTNYDAGGRLLSRIDPDLGFGSLTYESYTYDAQGRQLTRRDRAGHVWTRAYSVTGQLESETDPMGQVTLYVYDDEGRLTKTTSPKGAASPAANDFETTRTLDAAGRLLSIRDPLGGDYVYTYDEAGNLRTETDPSPVGASVPSTTTYDYDGRGRRISEADALDATGNETRFAYDGRGLLLSTTEPHPSGTEAVWTATYTPTGEIDTTVDPMGVTIDYTYDVMNRIELETELFTGRVTDYDYDAAGRVREVRVEDGSGILTSTGAEYDLAGNLKSIADPRDFFFKVVEYDYDALNRITAERDALGFEVGFQYEERGLLDVTTAARSTPGQPVTLDYGYDFAGRQNSLTGTDGPTGTWTISESLDLNGNSTASLVDTSAAISVVSREFDELDRQTTRVVELPTLPSAIQPSVSSEYDAAGNLSKVIYSDGREVEYEYDALSRLTLVRDWQDQPKTDSRVTTYDYDVAGKLSQVNRPDGSQATYTYDRAGKPISIVDTNPVLPQPTIFQADFVVDGAGRRQNATFVLPLEVDPTLEPARTFSYDAANRLVGRNDGTTQDSFVYDADGNLVSGRLGGAATDLSLDYNALNQLVAVDGEIIRYDADGRRASRQVGASTTFYLYDTEGRLIEEIDENGNRVARYVHGLGVISREDAGTGQAHLYHYDSRGSTVALTDATDGTITDTYAYLPYGGVQEGGGNTTPNPFKYNGRDGVVDDGNGLYLMGARYYAPELMRFIQKDPIFEGELGRPQSLNRYAFVEGKPIEFVDPTGEFGFISAFVGAVVGGTIGAVTAIATGEDLEGILTSAAAGAITGAVIGGTGGAGLFAAGFGGGLQLGVDLATGGVGNLSASSFFVGAAAGAVGGLGAGSLAKTVASSAASGALAGLAEGGNLEERLKSAAIGGAFGGALGGAGRVAGGAIARSSVGKRIATSARANSFANTRVGQKVLKLKNASRNLLKKAGRPNVGRAGRRGAISISRGAVVEEGFDIFFKKRGVSVGRSVGEELAGAF